MKIKLFAAVLLLFVSATPSFLLASDPAPDDDTFISLTRRPTAVDHLPSNISIITAEEIKQSGAKTLDEILSLQPSVDLNRTGTIGSFSTVRMRGVPNSAQVQIVVDDEPYGGISADQLVDISQISLDNIERIEIVRGGASVLYGANTTGGLIHLITKKHPNGQEKIYLGYETQSLNTHIEKIELGAETNKTDGVVSAHQFKTDGFQRNSDANEKNISTQIGQSFENGGRLSFHVGVTNSNVGVPQGTAIPISDWDGSKERPASNATNRTDQQRMEGRIKISEPLGPLGRAESTFFGSDSFYNNHMGAGAFDTPYEKTNHVLGNDTRFLFNQGSTFGFSYERDEYRDVSISPLYITNVGSYAQHEFTWEKGSFIPALRYDHHKNFGSEYCPRITLVVRPIPRWAISTNVARSYRAPSFFDLYFDYAPTNFRSNRNLKPETAWTYDFGNKIKITSNDEISLTGYYTKIKDRIAQIDPGNDGIMNNTDGNVSKAELSGMEFEFKGMHSPFFHRGNYTYQRAKETAANRSQFIDIALTPTHRANYVWGWTTKNGFTQTQTWQYVGKQYELDGHTGRVLPSHGLWHIRIAQKVKMFELFAGINNILDKRYAEAFDFDSVSFVNTIDPLPGRTYLAGVTFSYP